MEHDFVYCPRCTRYSVFHWIRRLGQWECEDCSSKLPKEEMIECTTSAPPALSETVPEIEALNALLDRPGRVSHSVVRPADQSLV